MKFFFIPLIAFCTAISVGFTLDSSALDLYGTSQPTEEQSEEEQQSFLNKIDPDTGVPTRIGPMGVQDCAGLDFEPFTNTLYGVCERLKGSNGMPLILGPAQENRVDPEDVGQVLVSIDVGTGMATEIGPLGINPAQTDSGVTDISFSPNGILYAIITGFPELPGGGGMGGGGGLEELAPAARALPEVMEATLLTIDTNTGQASIVGPTGTGSVFGTIGFSEGGSLYHSAENFVDATVHMLDPTNGLASKLSDIAHPIGPEDLALIYSMDHSRPRNQLFAMLLVFPERPDRGVGDELEPRVELSVPGFYLTTIDPGSGEVSVVGPTSVFTEDGPLPEFYGAIAFLNRTERNVPTMSEYGLIATSIFLLLAAVIYLRRKQLKEAR